MKRILLLLMICLLCPEPCLAAPDREVLIRHAPVPADPPYQGEVRLLRRDSAQVVQTLLNSKVMNRVLAAIQKKELKAWPKDREGSADSRRYTGELLLAYETVRERARERRKGGERDRYLQLMIEFVLEGERSYVALYAPTLTRKGDGLVLHERELLKKLTLSRGYVQKNMQLILEDNFDLDADQAHELLQQAGER